MDASVSGYVSVCLPGGTGAIIDQFAGGGSINTQLNSMTGSLSIMGQYRTYSTSDLTNNVTDVQTAIDAFVNSDTNDISYDTASLGWFNAVANRTKFAAACSPNANYDADSIVPSFGTSSLSEVPCFGATTQQASSDLTSSPAGCLSLENIFTNNGVGLAAALTGRYGAACSAVMEPALTAVKTNWRTPRTSGIGAVSTRFASVRTGPIADVTGNMTTLVTDINTAYLALNTTISGIIDPTYGVLQGFNCLLMG